MGLERSMRIRTWHALLSFHTLRNQSYQCLLVEWLDAHNELAEQWGEPTEDLNFVPLADGNLGHTVWIGSNLDWWLKSSSLYFCKKMLMYSPRHKRTSQALTPWWWYTSYMQTRSTDHSNKRSRASHLSNRSNNRDRQAFWHWLHQRDHLRGMDLQCGQGKKGKWKIINLYRLHRLE